MRYRDSSTSSAAGITEDPPERLPEIGIGTYDVPPETCMTAVRSALDWGYRHVDTAEMYGNEAAVGRAIEKSAVRAEEVFIATKVHSQHLSYDDVLKTAEASQERLGVETIDLLYVHWPIRTYHPEETLAAFDELYDRGTIHHIGLSNFTPHLLTEAIDLLDAPLFAHQVECHPLLNQPELRDLAREHDHYLVAYSPLAKGEVTAIPELVDIAEEYGATPAQVALAWVCSQDEVVAIPKSTDENHIRDNFAARNLELEEGTLARINAIERTNRMVDFPDAPWR